MQDPTDHGASATAVGGDCFHANRAGAEQFVGAVARLVPRDRVLPLWLQVNDSSFTPVETLTLTATITPESIPMVVDL
jgi:hypothetical protein